MLVLVIESFRNGDPRPIYERVRDTGRGLPEGLEYIDSWVSADLTRCFQLMDVADQALLDAWIEGWTDLVEFEVVPVITSAEAAERALL